MKKLEFDNKYFSIQILSHNETPDKKRQIGTANMFLNQLPALVGAQKLSQAYKVVLPAGVAGHLMEIKNGVNTGLNTTSIIGASGKISGQAGLQSLANLATPMAIFSLMSIITGQYFMAQINNSIKTLSESIEEVQKQIDTSEESVVFSASIFLQEVQNDWNLILGSEEFRISIITNIIKTLNDLTSSCYYFENRLNTKMTELINILKKNKIVDEVLREEISRNKEFIKYAYEIRSCLKIILIFLTSSVSKNNADEVKDTLKNDEILLFSSTVKQLELKIDEIIVLLKQAPSTKLQEQASEIKPIIIGIKDITRDRFSNCVRNNIETAINKIKEIDEKGQIFYIEGNKLFIEEMA